MINLILNGAKGRMGQAVSSLIDANKASLTEGGAPLPPSLREVPRRGGGSGWRECGIKIIYSADMDNPISGAPKNADVILDFSTSSALHDVLAFALENSIPLILATTGYSSVQLDKIKKASEQIPILRSASMSIGANLLIKLAAEAAQILGNSFDIEIIEKHHNKKIDAPSGVALAIADSIANVKKGTKYVYERHSTHYARESSEIGISSIRGGTIVGEHTALFAGPHEVIELTHKAESREIFAHGALAAVEFIVSKPAGLYSMQDVICI